jgi:5-methylcytosine-specific restriction endonuclease McrA
MDNLTAYKTCTKCRADKPLAEFNKQAKSKDGHHYYCRECQRAYVAANRAAYRENAKRWQEANPEKAAAKLTRWRQANAEHVQSYKTAYRAGNPEKLRAAEKAYYADNADRLRAAGADRAKRWRESNPEKSRKKDQRRRAMKLEAYVEDVDIVVVLEAHGARCIVCGINIDTSLSHPHPMSVSLEHVIPLARGGEHSYKNCAPSHLRCNISKGVKPLGDFAS